MSWGIISAIKAICLGHISDRPTQILLGTRCHGAAGTTIGTTTTKAKSVNAINYSINGKVFAKAGTDDLWTLSGTTIPVSSTGRFLLCLNAAGTASVLQGDATTNAEITLDASGLPTVCPIAELKIATDATHTFVPGTTALNGAGITATYTDISVLPVGGVAA